jgi:hypothetical protein
MAEDGLRVKPGETAVRVANLRLFHRDQCQPATKQEISEHKAKLVELAAKRTATVSPIAPAPVAPVKAKGRKAPVVPINQPSV